MFRGLSGRRGLVLAVSGGADSTALMVLAAKWPARPPLLIVTVDHGLRPESADEARLVAANAERLGLPSRIIAAPTRQDGGNLQDWARRIRYQSLVAAAGDAGCDTIVTAHHQDDQAETFLLRLARGSGVYGLSAMAEAGVMDGVLLARPLLKVSRGALAKVAIASGLQTIDDPSNCNPQFDRIKLRTLAPTLAEHGLSTQRLAETAARLRRAASALDHYTALLLRTGFEADAHGVVTGDAALLASAPEEIALRALALILRAAGGAAYTPSLDSIEGLRAALLQSIESGAVKRTLHGVVLVAEHRRVSAHREWGRSGIAGIPAPAGASMVWDRRFRVEVPSIEGELEVGPLGAAAAAMPSLLREREPIRTLPGLFRNGTLIAAPAGLSLADATFPLDPLEVECLVGARLLPDTQGLPGERTAR